MFSHNNVSFNTLLIIDYDTKKLIYDIFPAIIRLDLMIEGKLLPIDKLRKEVNFLGGTHKIFIACYLCK